MPHSFSWSCPKPHLSLCSPDCQPSVSGQLAPPLGPAFPAHTPVPPHHHHLFLLPVWPRCFCLRESKPRGLTLDAVLLSLSVSSFAIVLRLALFHSCLLKICPLFFLYIRELQTKKHNSKSSNKGTWLLWLSFVSL